jgi:putative heme-binding domain-containing protein
LHRNDWFVRHSRRLLQERAAAGANMTNVHDTLWTIFRRERDVTRQLRALWALHVTGGLSPDSLFELLNYQAEHIRAWAIRLETDSRQPLANLPSRNVLGKFVQLAVEDPSRLVRLHIASALQRIPLSQRWQIAAGLVNRSDDSSDANLALMIWYGVEPLATVDRATASALAGRSKIPIVRHHLARRITFESAAKRPDGSSFELTSLFREIQHAADAAVQLDLLRGIYDALKGVKNMRGPRGWDTLAEQLAGRPAVSEQALTLGLVFGDPRAATALRKIMMNRTVPPQQRQRAIQILVDGGVPNLSDELRSLLEDPDVRGAAIRALASIDDPATPPALLERYQKLADTERADAISTLAARPSFARTLIQGIDQGIIPRRDISPYIARQIQAFNDRAINAEFARVWGTVRSENTQKRDLIAKYKALATISQPADAERGRAVFQRTCAQCHRLFGEGNDIGPDLTGSNRSNLDYVLENVIDPDAIVGRDFKLNIIATKDGRVLSGIVRERSDKTMILQSANDRITLALDDIDQMKESSKSMMPEGIFETMTPDEVRDLIAYLSTSVPAKRSN